MTETVTITGDNLNVTHDQAGDPKRKRPPRFKPSEVPAGFRTVQDVIEQGNPYHTEAANDAADRTKEQQHAA